MTVTYVPSAAVHTLVDFYIHAYDTRLMCAGHRVAPGAAYAIDHLIMTESGMSEEDSVEYAGEMIVDARLRRA